MQAVANQLYLGYSLSVLEMLLMVPVISIVALGEVGIPRDSILLFGLVIDQRPQKRRGGPPITLLEMITKAGL
jgi:hypothetical protein